MELKTIDLEVIGAIKRLAERGEAISGWPVAHEIEKTRTRKIIDGRPRWLRWWPSYLHAAIGFGTLYNSLQRLEASGYLISEWEVISEAEKHNRPRRRFYKLTGKEVSDGSV